MENRFFEDQSNLGKIQDVSIDPKLIAFGRDTAGNPISSDCIYSRPRITFPWPRPLENKFYQIQNAEGRIENIFVQKNEPKENGYIVLADVWQ